MNTNEAAIRDWFQGVLTRISQMGRFAQVGIGENGFPRDAGNIEKTMEDIQYWQNHLDYCQIGLNELKELVEVFGKSEK